MNPLISILIPFKNTEEYLLECIESIRKQTYTNWEVLAVNDHSTDNSLEIITDVAQKDYRIQVITNKGKGIIQALRTAYSLSKGEFITRMDSDDLMTPIRLQYMVNALLQNGAGHLSIGQVKYFSAEGISNGYERYEKWLNSLTAIGANYSEIYKECVIPSPCWMVFREDFDACEAFKPERYPEDYDLAFRFYKEGLKVIPCNEVLLQWRDYNTRTSRTSEHYAQNYFLDIKLYYFLKLEHDPTKELFIWGAGKKGKEIAKMLLEKKVPFHWVCDNPKKIGKDIYGEILKPYQYVKELTNPQCLITVANEDEQLVITNFLKNLNIKNMKSFFFFC